MAGAALVAALALGGCTSSAALKVTPEAFGSTTTHSRSYQTAARHVCEAARRALLSQGFLITASNAELAHGRKNFQPDAETHVEIEFHVVCVDDGSDGAGGTRSIAFVNALQDRYALKKSNNSASVGVGALGSLSLPFSSSDDALVKVASETITTALFYDRYFALLQRYLGASTAPVGPRGDAAKPSPSKDAAPVAPAAQPTPDSAPPSTPPVAPDDTIRPELTKPPS